MSDRVEQIRDEIEAAVRDSWREGWKVGRNIGMCEVGRFTCNVEATADAEDVKVALRRFHYAQRAASAEPALWRQLELARQQVVRAVLSHVHPQPREKGTTFGPDADSYNHVFGCESPPRADESAPQPREKKP